MHAYTRVYNLIYVRYPPVMEDYDVDVTYKKIAERQNGGCLSW